MTLVSCEFIFIIQFIEIAAIVDSYYLECDCEYEKLFLYNMQFYLLEYLY